MIAVTCGDPEGVGPEVAVVAAVGSEDVTLVGPRDLWVRAAALRGVELRAPVVEPEPVPGVPWGALPELAAVHHAVRGCLEGRYDALCTAPIHKAPLLDAGFVHPGHTDWLAELCGVPVEDTVMLFAGGTLRVALVTAHVPLRRVPDVVTADRIVRTTRVASRAVVAFGPSVPRVAVCGLNPHAGEEGKLGSEDAAVVAPAVARLRAEGVDASGPHPADTVFGRAARGEFDLVVAMYHDQGLTPVKTLDAGRSVNITAGLPIVRTSVDHGTARDIAWTGCADATSMAAALRMARDLCGVR